MRHYTEDGPQFVGGHVADVAAVDPDLAVGGLVETEQHLGQCAFAAAGGAHQDAQVSGFEGEVEVAVQVGVLGTVAEAQIFEFNVATLGAVASCRGECIWLGRHVHDIAQTFYRDVGLLEFLP